MATVPQFIEIPGGDRLVVMPEAEYLRLLDTASMVEDIGAYDEAKRRLAAGEEEMIPAEVVDRLLAGENPVRVWREYRGLSASTLAEAAGIAQPYLSQIETGKREGSIETLRLIAAVLKLTLDDIAG